MSYANLTETELHGANLLRADLNNANLTLSSMNRAFLTSADLSGADLNKADLRSSELTEVIWGGSILSSVKLGGNLGISPEEQEKLISMGAMPISGSVYQNEQNEETLRRLEGFKANFEERILDVKDVIRQLQSIIMLLEENVDELMSIDRLEDSRSLLLFIRFSYKTHSEFTQKIEKYEMEIIENLENRKMDDWQPSDFKEEYDDTHEAILSVAKFARSVQEVWKGLARFTPLIN